MERSTKKIFKRSGHTNNQLYEVELADSDIEYKEPIIVAFIILQYAKLRLLQLYTTFFTQFFHAVKLEEVEMDTDLH